MGGGLAGFDRPGQAVMLCAKGSKFAAFYSVFASNVDFS